MKIQVYKTKGCPKCQQFARNLELTMQELDLGVKVQEIDLDTARSLDIRACPALIVDNNVVSSGQVLSVDELKKLLKKS